jgi:GPI mannosyltransferase 3
VWRESKRQLAIILIGAALVRIVICLFSDNLNHPDENFQIYEQAHRLVFGYGIIPWEFQQSVRSWIVPGIVSLFLYIFKFLNLDNPNIYIPLIKIIIGLFSLIVVYSAYQIGHKLHSIKAGLFAALFCAFWYEIIYFSIRPLSENWAVFFFLPALALAIKPATYRHLVFSGILAGLSLAIRPHYFPVIIILMIMVGKSSGRKNLGWLITGLILSITFIGLFEKITVGGFYGSYINYFSLAGKYSSTDSIISDKPFIIIKYLGNSSLFISWAVIIASIFIRRHSLYLILMAISIIFLHSLLPLKEYIVAIRFVYMAIVLIMIIFGILMAELISKYSFYRFRFKFILPSGLLMIFTVVSVSGALNHLPDQNKVYRTNLFYQDPVLAAYKFLYLQNDLKGILDNSEYWFNSGGYYYLHRPVSLYFPNQPPQSRNDFSHIISRNRNCLIPGFVHSISFGESSVFVKNSQYALSEPDQILKFH